MAGAKQGRPQGRGGKKQGVDTKRESTGPSVHLVRWVPLLAAAAGAAFYKSSSTGAREGAAELELPANTFQRVSCAAKDYRPPVAGCTPTLCGQYRADAFFTVDEVTGLRSLAERGRVPQPQPRV